MMFYIGDRSAPFEWHQPPVWQIINQNKLAQRHD